MFSVCYGFNTSTVHIGSWVGMLVYTLFINYENIFINKLIMGAGWAAVGCDNVVTRRGFRVRFPVGNLKKLKSHLFLLSAFSIPWGPPSLWKKWVPRNFLCWRSGVWGVKCSRRIKLTTLPNTKIRITPTFYPPLFLHCLLRVTFTFIFQIVMVKT